MNQKNKQVRIIAYLMIVVSMVWIGLRLWVNQVEVTNWTPGHKYQVEYQFSLDANGPYWVESFLPITSQRQKVDFMEGGSTARGLMALEGDNKLIRWEGEAQGIRKINYQFEFTGRPIQYQIDSTLRYEPVVDPDFVEFLTATELVQADHDKIVNLGEQLTTGQVSMLGRLNALFNFVNDIPAIATSELTDALTALNQYEASCNGKSRLLTALYRSQGIPARLVGGIILEETKKKTSHLWTEVYVGGEWVPMDALNGHFASLPEYYLELYRGDEFLITRKAGMGFDYLYDIKKERVNHYPKLAMLDLWTIMDETEIPSNLMQMLMLLPLGAFLVALFKNVVGIKTFGVFLPVLVALSLIQTGVVSGLILFSAIVFVVALISLPLERWGIQYTSKIALMLIAVVITSLSGIRLLHSTEWLNASAPLFFPIIILTIISERFAKKVEEDGVKAALGLYAQTLVVTLFIYFVLSSTLIQQAVVTFPELIIALAGLNMLLGKWIGLRLTEYHRFHKVINA